MSQRLGKFRTNHTKRLETIPGKTLPQWVEVTEHTPPEIAEYQPSGLAADITEHANSLLVAKNTASFSAMLEGVLFRTEALESSRIEGISSTPRHLVLAKAGSETDMDSSEAARNLQAVQRAVAITADFGIAEICELNRIVLAPYNYAGKIRKLSVTVGEEHGCPYHRDIRPLLSDWEHFLANCRSDIITKSAVAHAQFECIHPFLDGNGRTGRALTSAIFADAGFRFLPVSAALRSQREMYFAAFESYADSDPEPMVFLHAAAVIAAAAAVQDLSAEHSSLAEKWGEKLASERETQQKRSVLAWLSANPAFTSEEMTAGSGCGIRTASRYLSALENAQIIARSEAKASNRRDGPDKQIWEVPELHEIAAGYANAVAENMAELVAVQP